MSTREASLTEARQWLKDIRRLVTEQRRLRRSIGLVRCGLGDHEAVFKSGRGPCPHCRAAI